MRKSVVSILTLILLAVWLAVINSPKENLQVIACDVGQGDAILIQKGNDQILIDGGPNSSVLDCLGRYMPFWDHQIEIVINTHPEKDHAAGLASVLESYGVDTIIINDLSKPSFSSEIVGVLQSKVGGSGARVVVPTPETKVRLGLIHLDILHPDKDFENSNANNYSIVTLLTYSNFEAIFTGDIEDKVSDKIAENWKGGHVDYIKIPHHGSKNGVSENLIRIVEPKIAVISVGKKNSYGHPHQEVLDLLSKYSVQVLRTDQLVDVVVETDGEDVFILRGNTL